jgi:hypothetical protein
MEWLDRLTHWMNELSLWGQKNPDLARQLTEVVGGLGLLATAVGTLGTALLLAKPVLELLGFLKGVPAAAGAAATGVTAAGVGSAAIVEGAALYGLKQVGMDGGAFDFVTGVMTKGFTKAADDSYPALSKASGSDILAALPRVPGVAAGMLADKLKELGSYQIAPIAEAVKYGLATLKSSGVTMTGTINLDGKVAGTFLANKLAAGISTPNAGTTSFDASGTPVTPSNVGH